jgi:predicted Zn-dependent peptidase
MPSRLAVLVTLLLAGCAPRYQFTHEALNGFDDFPPSVPTRGQVAALPSGMRLVTYQVEGDRDVEMLLGIQGDLKLEVPGKEGISALAARLLEAASRPPRGRGATLYTSGVFTAWRVNLDALELEASCKNSQLGLAVKALSQVMEEPGAGLTEADVAEQREQMAGELERVGDGYRQQSLEVLSRTFAGTSYAVRPPTPGSIRRLTLQDVRDYLKSVARPARAVLAVVSGLPPEQSLHAAAQALSPRVYGDPATPVAPVAATPVTKPVAKATETEIVTLRTDERRLWVAWAIPGEGDTTEPSATFAGMFLADEASKRLRKEKLLEKGKQVATTTWVADGITSLSVAVPLQRKEDAERVRSIVLESMEMARIKASNPYYKNWGPRRVSLNRYYRTEGRPQLEDVGPSMRIAGEPDPNVRFMAAVREQNGNLLKFAIATWQERGPAAVVLFEPEDGTTAPPPDRILGGVKGPWKEVLRPVSGTVPGLDIVRGRIDSPGLDKAERFTLGNGLQLAVLPRRGSPFVRVGLAIPGANSPSEVARAHAAIRTTAAKLPAGCSDGARILGTAGSEHYVSTRASGLRYAMEVLACWTTASETEVVETQLNPAEAAWLGALDQVAVAAPAAPLDQAPGWGRRWFRRTLRPGGATLVVVGDVSPAAVHAMASSVFSKWREPDGSQPVLGPTVLPPPASRTVIVADYPKAFAGWVGVMVRRQAPLEGASPEQELLAWMLAARLRDRLPAGACRVRVRAVDSGPLTGLLVTVEGLSDRLVANLSLVLDELRQLQEEAADPAQLAAARWNAIRRRTFAFSRTGSTTEELVDLSMLKLPPDGFERLGDQYAGVSAERVEALWAVHAVGKEGILVAAPWEIVSPQLQAMGLEATRVVPVEQVGAADTAGHDED